MDNRKAFVVRGEVDEEKAALVMKAIFCLTEVGSCITIEVFFEDARLYGLVDVVYGHVYVHNDVLYTLRWQHIQPEMVSLVILGRNRPLSAPFDPSEARRKYPNATILKDFAAVE